MFRLQNLINKAKKHPIFTSLAFLGALIIALGSFTDAISTLSNNAGCLPIKFGIAGPYEGQIVVKLTRIEKNWRKLRTVKTERKTGNHHCKDNCRGEPTRSNYLIELSSSDYMTINHPTLQLRNPKIKCKKGPCGAWNHVLYAKESENSKSVRASFDVWSHPTIWELSADLYSFDVVEKEELQTIIDISSDQLFTITIPSNQTVDLLKGVMRDKRQYTWNIGESDPSGTVVLVSKSKKQSGTKYIYQVNDKRCE